MTAICWECPFVGGVPTCDPSRARCPNPPLPAEEQERITQRLGEWSAWVVHDGTPPLSLNITSGSVTDSPDDKVRRTINIDMKDADL